MTNLKFLTAILVLCICNYTQVFGSALLQTFFYNDISLAIPSSGSISHNKIVYGLCKNSDDSTTIQCNIYANSTQFGETFMESCPIELSPGTKNSTLILTSKTVYQMSDDRVILVWHEVSDMWEKYRLKSEYPVSMHIHLIDLKNCDVLKNISLDAHLRPGDVRETEQYNVIFLDDGSFQVGYFNLNPHSTSIYDRYLPYYIVYDKNGNVVEPAQSPDIPDILKSNASPFSTSDLLGLYINHWLPISPAKGHFFITIHKMREFNENEDVSAVLEAKLSVFTSDNKVKITKNLDSLKNIKGMSYGHENVAYCVSYNKQSSLRCSMLDSELNVVYNVSLHPGFGFSEVKIFVLAPNEMLVLVSDRRSYNAQWNLRAYKINSTGRVGKPVVIDGYDDYRKYNRIDMELSTQYLTVFDDRVCFHFSMLNLEGQGIIIDSCVNKQALDRY